MRGLVRLVIVLFPVAVSGCGGSPLTAPTLTGTVLLRGTLKIGQTETADLDRGIVAVSAGSDVWFEAVRPNERYLTPENGARFLVVGARALGFEACRMAEPSAARIPINTLTVGVNVCGVTKQGRVVEFRVEEPAAPYVAGSSIPTLTITFTTYR